MNYMKEALARLGYDEDPIYKHCVLISDLGIYNICYYQDFSKYEGMSINEVIECTPFWSDHDFTDYVEDYTLEIWKDMESELFEYDTIVKTVDVIHNSIYDDMIKICDRICEELFKIKHELKTKKRVAHD